MSGHRLGYLGVLLVPLAYCCVLMASLAAQATGDLPCELCLMQRLCMLLVCTGPLFILRRARDGDVEPRDFARGYGISIVAAVAGGLVSLHQLILTNGPGGYTIGPDVLGLHTYTWALVTSVVMVLFAAANMIWSDSLVPVGARYGTAARAVTGLYLAIVVIITILTFVQAGFHNGFHTYRYQLLYDLGIK